ncbi:MAG: 50S ribosomal protein L18 [Elusimicrobiota bacterium]
MKRVHGTKERPRLTVFRSNRNIYAQLVDDDNGNVIAGISSLNEEMKKKKFANPKERAREIGKVIAKIALDRKIQKVVFDRKRYKYHGAVKELADGAREGGLEF